MLCCDYRNKERNMSRPHPIAAALGAVLEELAALAALVGFIVMLAVWSGVIGGSI